MARPTKYTEEKANHLAALLKGGCTRKDAAGSIGIDYHTLLDWLERRPAFADLVEKSESFCAVNMTTILTKAAKDDPRWALEWLKRRRPDEWSDAVKLAHSGEVAFKAYNDVDTDAV